MANHSPRTAEPDSLPILSNERAGLGGHTPEQIENLLEKAGLSARVRSVRPAELEEAIREAAASAVTVAVCGGDGTLMGAAEVLAGSETALALVPTGTLNHFARRLGLDSVEAATAAISAGEVTRVPVGVVDDRIFLNTATFGLYADVVRRRERLRKWFTKWPAAGVALVERLITMRRLRVTLEVNGKRVERLTPLVWIGVGWGSFPRVHQAPERRSAPDLELVVLQPRGRLGVVTLGFRFIAHLVREKRPVRDPALHVLHARSVIIHADRPIGVTLDGEVLRMEPPVFVGVVDGALRVVAPSAPVPD